jgi:hypothetical protein
MVRRLLRDHELLAGAYADARELFAALAGLHEVENLKLAWRAVRRGIPAERWVPLWRPLGALTGLRLSDCREAGTLAELADRAAKGPWGEVVAAAARRGSEAEATPDAELAFDRFASRRLVRAARALPRREHAAASLVLGAARARDLEVLCRAPARGLTPALAASACALLPEELGAPAVQELAGQPRELERLLAAARRDRQVACRRAFLAPPFLLTPAVALLLLEGERIDQVTAVVEASC